MIRLILAILFCLPMWAATTTVEGTIQNPDGTLFMGTVTANISLPCTASDGSRTGATTVRQSVINGALSVGLQPNDTCNPTGTTYAVQYLSTTNESWAETWSVPTSASPVPVSTVIINPTVSENNSVGLSQINLSYGNLVIGSQGNVGMEWICAEGQIPKMAGGIWICGTDGGGGGGAPANAGYWTKTPNAELTNEFALSNLATGILKNTTTTGIPTIAVAGVDYEGPISIGSPNEFYGWDKTFRSIDWSYLVGSQPAPIAHAASHQTGGSDELDLPSIPGQLPTARTDLPLLNGQQQDLNVQQDTILSAGAWKDEVIADAGGGAINVATGVGQIRSGATETSPLLTFEWPTTNGLIPADGASSYVIARYNAGTPDVVVQAGSPNRYSEILLGYVTRAGTTLSITNIGWNVSDLDNRLLDWMDSVGGVRDERVGGLVVYDNATFVAMDSGRYIDLLKPVTIPAFDSSGTDRYTWWYRDGVGGWTSVAGQQTWPTDQYDDGSGTLATLQNNRYGTLYWYINGSIVHLVFGRLNTNDLAVAQDDGAPPDLPPLFAEVTHISSKWIIRQGTTSPTEVLSAWAGDAVSGGGQVTDHSALSGRSNPDQHPASSVTNTPQGGVTETDVQGAIDGLEARKLDKTAADASFQIVAGDGTNTINVGAGVHVESASSCTLTRAAAYSTVIGSIQLDVWKDTYANFPPTDADSITGAAPIVISGSNKYEDVDLTGWDTAIAVGDVLWFNVDSATTVNQVTVTLICGR